MQNYFNATCRNIEDAKYQYKDLYKFHCKDVEVMEKINAHFTAFKLALTMPVPAENDTQEVTGANAGTSTDIAELAKYVAANTQDCKVEICGQWLWVNCDKENTVAHEILRANKFRFSGNKKAWYYTSQPFKKRRGTKTLPQIRVKFGAEPVQGEML